MSGLQIDSYRPISSSIKFLWPSIIAWTKRLRFELLMTNALRKATPDETRADVVELARRGFLIANYRLLVLP